MHTARLLFFTALLAGILPSAFAEPLHDAARTLDVEKIRQLLDAGEDVNAKDADKNNDRETPLIHAIRPYSKIKWNSVGNAQIGVKDWIYADNIEVVTLLLDRGADVNAKDEDGNTPLIVALSNPQTNDLNVIKLLLDRGADINAKNNDGRTALTYAMDEDIPVIRLLLDRGADVNAKDKDGDTPLMRSAGYNGNCTAVKLLLERGAEINATNKEGKTALDDAVAAGKTDIVKLLMERGAQSQDSQIAGAVNAHERNVEMLRLLLDRRTNTTAIATSLFLKAVENAAGNLSMIAYSIENSPSQTKDYTTKRQQDLKIVQLLLEKGADINVTDSNKQTAVDLTTGSRGLDIEMLKLLVDRGADLNKVGWLGHTPIGRCIDKAVEAPRMIRFCTEQGDQDSVKRYKQQRNEFLPAIKFLLSKGANINAKEFYNESTALHAAARENDLEMIELLLQNGAEVNATDKEGSTALAIRVSDIRFAADSVSRKKKDGNYAEAQKEWADVEEMMKTVKLLLDRGADVNVRDRFGDTPLGQATICGYKELVALLLAKGADANAVSNDGTTPLMDAVWSDNCPAEVLTLLLDHGADPEWKSPKTGDSALDRARYRWNFEILETALCKRLDYAVRAISIDNPKVTEALISAKNRQLPGFLATATNDQKVDLLTAVESQIAKATARIDELNGQAADAIAKKQDAAPYRARVGQVKAYINVLGEIKTILEQS
jgi:ankyrin repeat protein